MFFYFDRLFYLLLSLLQVICSAVAVAVQYLFLSAMFLLLVQSFALIVKMKTALQARSRITTYCILGWGKHGGRLKNRRQPQNLCWPRKIGLFIW